MLLPRCSFKRHAGMFFVEQIKIFLTVRDIWAKPDPIFFSKSECI